MKGMSICRCHTILSIAILALSPCAVVAQPSSANYVLTETMLSSDGSRSVRSIQYYDGLGRPSALASNGQNTNGKYVYTLTEYDLQGRENKLWLASAGSTIAAPVTPAEMATISSASHQQDDYAFSTISYDAIGRETFRSTPGRSWHDSGNHMGVKTEYVANKANSVKKYVTDSSGNLVTSAVSYYPAGSLTGEKTTDEDGHTIEIYKDLLDHVVLERRDGNNDTYYVYDKGLLCVVIPPQFQNEANTSLLYRYKYDGHGRCIEKILPGCSPVKLWYDRYGRLAFMQDARLLSSSLYRFYLYDGLNRLVVQGVCSYTSLMGNAGYVAKAVYQGRGTEVSGTGYRLASGSQLSVRRIEIANYYDGYLCLNLPIFDGLKGRVGTLPSNPATTLQTAQLLATSDNKSILRATFYDEKANITDVHEYHADGTYQKTHISYTFTNQPEVTTVMMTKNGHTTSVSQKNVYDQLSGLLSSTKTSTASGSWVETDSYSYDDLGRRSMLGHHDNALQTAYEYNVNGWLSRLHSTMATGGRNLFSEDVCFTDGPGTACYNGNISAVKWSTDSPAVISGYKYSYDGLNRILTAKTLTYSDGLPVEDHAGDLELTYNANSSITTLKRYGRQNNQSNGMVDHLTYSYVNGNQLSKITDAASAVSTINTMAFSDNTISTNGVSEYGYDGCGSMTYDANKGVVKIEYDQLGYPRRVYFSNYGMTEYVYRADGVRLKTRHVTAVPRSTPAPLNVAFALSEHQIASVDSTEYYGSYIFENGLFSRFNFGSGYVVPSGAGYAYKYYLKDHLGNNRMVVSSGGTIEQVTHYDPYGATLACSNGQEVQPYKYNGKELDRMHRLDLYDYGARQYDPVIGLFTQIDPLAEKYYHISPYAYCAANPVKYLDPDGKDPGDFFGVLDNAAKDFGKYINAKSIKENKEYITAFYKTKDDKGNWGYSYIEPVVGGKADAKLKTITKNGKEYVNGKEMEATGHTHGAYDKEKLIGNDVFSGITKDGKLLEGDDARKDVKDKGKDIGSSNAKGLSDYLITPNGSLQHYDPSTGHVRLVDSDMPKDPNDPYKVERAMNMYK